MSRTDHHRPYWVRCNDNLEPVYTWHSCCHPYRGHSECRVGPAFRPGDPRADEFTCGPELDVWRSSAPPAWFTHSRYHNRLRREARDVLQLARRDHNAHGFTDLEPEPIQAHNSAKYDYW